MEARGGRLKRHYVRGGILEHQKFTLYIAPEPENFRTNQENCVLAGVRPQSLYRFTLQRPEASITLSLYLDGRLRGGILLNMKVNELFSKKSLDLEGAGKLTLLRSPETFVPLLTRVVFCCHKLTLG